MSLLVLVSLASYLVCGGAAALPTFELPTRIWWIALTTVASVILAVAFSKSFGEWPTGLAAAGVSLLLQRLDDYLMVRADAALETVKALRRRS